MFFSKTKTILILSTFLLTGAFGIHSQNLEPANMLTIDSQILTEDHQDLIATWLGNEYGNHQAELVLSNYDIMDPFGSGNEDRYIFHELCDGRSNTLIVFRSPDGNTFGGYNSGAWSSTSESLYNLDDNFLFSLDDQEKYNAIPGEVHIVNTAQSMPHFGSNDFRFSNTWHHGVNRQGNNYECPDGQSLCFGQLNDGIVIGGPTPLDYVIDLYEGQVEIWQLKDQGPSSRSLGEVGIDTNDDGIIDYTGNCYANDNDMFPGSEIFDADSDDLISGWIPDEFDYKAELLFVADITEKGGGIEEWVFFSKDVQNTVIVMETMEGLKFGGYNSGIWDEESGTQTGLIDNFIFSITNQTKHNAIPGEVHITTGLQGPVFGTSDIEFIGSIIGDVSYSYLGSSYDCGIQNSSPSSCSAYLGGDEEFVLRRFELWKLKDTGTKVISVVDANQNGICDHMELPCPGDFDQNGFITAIDLSAFLGVFGASCN